MMRCFGYWSGHRWQLYSSLHPLGRRQVADGRGGRAVQRVIEVFATVKLDGHTKPLISRAQRDILQ